MGGFEPGDLGGAPGVPTPQLPAPIVDGGSPGVDAGSVSTAINTSVGYTTAVLGFLKGLYDATIGALLKQLHQIFQPLVDWLKHLKDTWLGHIVSNIWSRLKQIYDKLRAWAKKVHQTLEDIKKLQDYYYKQFVQPVLQFVDRLRRVLRIFRVLHFKWAEKLDNDLAWFERRAAKAFLETRRELNRILDYINLILDPTGLLRPNILLGTAAQSIAELIKLITDFQNPPLTQDQQKAHEVIVHQWDEKQTTSLIHEIATTGLPADWQADVTAEYEGFQDMGYDV